MTSDGYSTEARDVPLSMYAPLTAHAYFSAKLSLANLSRSLQPFPHKLDWYIQLEHHALVYCALRYLLHKERLEQWQVREDEASFEQTGVLVKYVLAALKPIVDLTKGFKASQPKQAAAILEALPTLLEGTPLKLEDLGL
ncbi:hypothetical protein JCM8097_000065 [Rhodosporidiobolus ruineniae]